MNIIEEFTSILNTLRKAASEYYIHLKPIMPDEEYDKLIVRARELEGLVPQDILEIEKKKGSPLWEVNESFSSVSGFETVRHDVPMISIRTEVDTSDTPIHEFLKRVTNSLHPSEASGVTYVAEPKYDGLAISLKYEYGSLSAAITRGDTHEGSNVINNVKTIVNIPKYLGPNIYDFEVRGEILCPLASFKRLNEELVASGKEPYANPRNAAAGMLRSHDSSVCAKSGLVFIAYRTIDLECKTHSNAMAVLDEMGFTVTHPVRTAADAKGLYGFYKEIEENRLSLPYEIDGVVYKVNQLHLQDKLGYTGKDLNWAVAHKFKAQKARTLLKDIKIQVGRTGRITPMAVLEPVYVGGTTVVSATFHNEDHIKNKDFRIGDTVIVHRAGDVVPEVDSVDFDMRTGELPVYVFPTTCPVCGSPLKRQEGEALHYCTGASKCPAQKALRLVHAASRPILDIEGLGISMIESLSEKNILNTVADFWKLTEEDFATIGVSPLVAAKILKVIQERRSIDMWRVLASLGINLLGKTLSAKLAPQLKDLEHFKNITKEEMLALDDVGVITANYVTTFVTSEAGRNEIEELIKLNLNLKKKEITDHRWPTAVITGKFPGMTREEITDIVQDVMGYRVVSGLSSSVKALICGDKPTKRKVDLAKVMGVEIIDDLDVFIKKKAST